MAYTFRMVMRSGPAAGKVFPLEKSELVVGRDLNNDVVINDPEVSRRHARLFVQGDTYVLEDLGSTNGTFVGGARLSGPYPLRPGEVVTFGERITMLYEVVQADQDATMVSTARPAAQSAQPPYVQPSAPLQQPYAAPQMPAQQPYAPPQQPAYVQPEPSVFAPPPPAQRQTAPLQQPPMYQSQPPLPVEPVYAGQIPEAYPPAKSKSKTWLIILIVLLLVACVCLALGLYFAPKEFWCLFPIWPAGSCP